MKGLYNVGNFYNNVLLGKAEGLPPCLARHISEGGWPDPGEQHLSAEIVCLFSPSRRGLLWERLLDDARVINEHWVCLHQECADWAEREADRLCPFEELPASFYRYVHEQAKEVARIRERGEAINPDAYPVYANAFCDPGKGTPLVPLTRIMGVLQMLGEPVSQRA